MGMWQQRGLSLITAETWNDIATEGDSLAIPYKVTKCVFRKI